MLKTCSQHELVEAGCDEAGRGPLAGPVAAAAVILPPEWNHPLLNDSKQMSEKNRYLLRDVIEREAVAWAVEMVFPEEIDRINILNASFAAMSRAVERLSVKPQLLLIDGNRFRTTLDIPYRCIVKGDVCVHRCGLGAGQNLPRRLHDADRRGISGIQLAEKQRISDPGTQGSGHAIRSVAIPPHVVQPRIRTVATVRATGRKPKMNNDKM